MREILAMGDLPQPDDIVHDAEHEELNLIWHDRKLVVVVELTKRAVADGRV